MRRSAESCAWKLRFLLQQTQSDGVRYDFHGNICLGGAGSCGTLWRWPALVRSSPSAHQVCRLYYYERSVAQRLETLVWWIMTMGYMYLRMCVYVRARALFLCTNLNHGIRCVFLCFLVLVAFLVLLNWVGLTLYIYITFNGRKNVFFLFTTVRREGKPRRRPALNVWSPGESGILGA